MSVTAAAILFVTIWFLTLFIVLQVTARTQGDVGEVVPGTHEGAPHNFRAGRTLLITTAIALPVFLAVAGFILSGWVSIEDLDWMGVLEDRTPN